MGRAERRKQERRQRQEDKKKTVDAARQLERDIKRNGIFAAETAVSNPYYMSQITQKRLAQKRNMEKNGITEADLKAEYEKGYAAARSDLSIFYIRMFYSAIAISLHRLFKFGETRIERVLSDVKWIMTEEICTDDILARCHNETGIDICCGDYDS